MSQTSRLRMILAGIVGLQAVALGLKALDDWRMAASTAVDTQERETAILAERLESRVRLVRTAMEVSARTGASRDLISGTTPDIDFIITMPEAARSDDPRTVAAIRTATRLIASGEEFGLSAEGDIIVAADFTGAGTLIAAAPAIDWLPLPQDGRRFSVIGDTGISVGQIRLERGRAIDTPGGFVRSDLSGRTVSSCLQPAGSQLTVCTARELPHFDSAALARLAFYGLLILGPALALLGLGRENAAHARARHTAEKDWQDAARLIDLVMQAAVAGNWEWREGTETLLASREFASLVGLPAEGEVAITRLMECVYPDDAEALIRTLRQGQTTGQIRASFRTRTSDGQRWLELRGQRVTDENAARTRFVGIVLDVTERKRAEERLRAAEQKLRTAIEGFNGPFALWDKRHRLVLWNTAFVRDFGLGDIAREGISYESIDLSRRAALRSERESVEDRRARELRLRDGRWLKVVERPTPDGGMITVGVDITVNVEAHDRLAQQGERMKRTMSELEHARSQNAENARSLEEQKIRAEQASKAKSAFLANVSHELRTPLNAINGFSQMIAKEICGPLGDKRYVEYAHDILASGQHLLDMINDILDMAKIEAGKMTISTRPIDPVDPVDAAVRMVRHRAEDKGIRLTLEAGDTPMIEADHRAVRQMALNLLSNAIKFTPDGGRVMVSVTRKDEFVRIAVRDSGIGIDKEDLPRLGRPFEQVHASADRNYEGTGLGLALTKSFADMHGGRMSIASKPGKGTLVAIDLPMARPSRVEAALRGAVEEEHGQSPA